MTRFEVPREPVVIAKNPIGRVRQPRPAPARRDDPAGASRTRRPKTQHSALSTQQPEAVHRFDNASKSVLHIAVVGCGGNGSQMLTRLARLDYAMRALGKVSLDVTAFDPDTVSRSNIGRQLFSPADLGQFKCEVLVNRVNAYYGLSWSAVPERYHGGISSFLGGGYKTSADVLVSCVDTAKARRGLNAEFDDLIAAPVYWLDLGNGKSTGQVILGQPERNWRRGVGTTGSGVPQQRLRTVIELFPELLNPKFKEDAAPSCSMQQALDKQSLFVNDTVVTWAAHLLSELLIAGEIRHCGYFINLQTGKVNPIPVPDRAVSRETP